MWPTSVESKTFRERLPFVGILTGAVGLLGIVAVWVVSLMDAFDGIFEDLPEALDGIMGLSGSSNYALGEFVGLINPIVVLVVAISGAAAVLAGEERDRTAQLLLAQPVTRRHVVRSKSAMLVVHLTITAGALTLASLLGGALADAGVSTVNMLAIGIHLFALGLAFAGITLAVANVTGSTAAAIGAGAGLAVVSNLMAGVLPLVDSLAWGRYLSPWYYYNGHNPLVNGASPVGIAVLLGLAAIGYGVAMWGALRRDIRSGGSSRARFEIPAVDLVTKPRVTSVFAKSMTDRVTILTIGGGALALMAIAVGAMYDGIQSMLESLTEDLPEGLSGLIGTSDIASPTGWINAEMLSIMAPAAIIGIAMVVGAKALAGEDDDRTLGMLMSAPISRTSVVVQKMLVMLLVVFGVAVITGVGIAIGSLIGGLDLGITNIAAAMFHLEMLGVLFGSLALTIGAGASSRTATISAASFALVCYLVNAILLIDESTASWARVTPWYYYNSSDPLTNGVDWAHIGVLAGLSVVVLAAAVPLFQRREINA